LKRMVEVMACNGLSVLSPSWRPLDRDYDDLAQIPVMFQHLPFSRLPANHTLKPQVGRKVNFILWQFALMTPKSFQCLRKLLIPHVNPFGAGIDDLFPYACAGYCMGLLDETTMHDMNLTIRDTQEFYEQRENLFDELGDPPSISESLGLLRDPIEFCGGRADPPQQDWLSHPHPIAPLPLQPQQPNPEEKHLPWILAWNASPHMMNEGHDGVFGDDTENPWAEDLPDRLDADVDIETVESVPSNSVDD